MKKPKPFATEADLCKAFLAEVPDTWTSYAETAGWDILLARKADGYQVGVQAKLKFNLDVVCQALEEHGGGWWSAEAGPDCRAILVPDDVRGIGRVADYIGLTVIHMRPPSTSESWRPRFHPKLPGEPHAGLDEREWHDWATVKRETLPDYVPDVAAGASAPLQLTDWKIRALKIAATIEIRGYVTRADFAHLNIDHRRWMAPNSWLRNDGGRLVPDRMPNFKGQHPQVYAEILAEADQWIAPEPAPPAQQALL